MPSDGATLVAPAAHDRFGRALAFIRANFADSGLCLDAVAEIAGVSRFHFSRMFKARTGVRFIEYLTTLRLAEAGLRLLTTADSVSDVCHAVGYRDLSHFQRMFRRRYGTTPSAYRQAGVSIRAAMKANAA
ncbi:hypothetical protein GCM10029978_076180 [Actinoallomurus acanthiterrae]